MIWREGEDANPVSLSPLAFPEVEAIHEALVDRSEDGSVIIQQVKRRRTYPGSSRSRASIPFKMSLIGAVRSQGVATRWCRSHTGKGITLKVLIVATGSDLLERLVEDLQGIRIRRGSEEGT